MTPGGAGFEFFGNDTAIDLVNTEIMEVGARTDLIGTPEQFQQWLTAAKLAWTGKWTAADLRIVHELRDAIREGLETVTAGTAPSKQALDCINRYLDQFPEGRVLTHADGRYALQSCTVALSPGQVIARLATAAAELLVTADPSTLKRCASHSCILWFKDVSRGRKRRWCSMETCGNRHKVAKHYRTSRTGSS